MADPTSVRVTLLGGFAVAVDGRRVPDEAWRLRKATSLVKLLALAPGHRLHWERIGEALWPDRGAAAARNNVHQVLRGARAALSTAGVDGHDLLQLRSGIVGFGERVALAVDVEGFTAAVDRAHAVPSAQSYETAAARYGGDLLPDDRYEDWTEAPRTVLREQHASLLLALAQRRVDEGDADAAVDVLRRLVTQQPLHEPARRALMTLLAAAGRRQDALAEYEALRDALAAELAADPDPESRRLYRHLLAGSVADPEPTVDAPPRRTDNLPVALSSFVGRDRELAEVERLLAGTRLLTLTGVGGAGKTRLALELARRRLGELDDGVWLVDLAPVAEPRQVPQAVAHVLGLELPERGSAVAAVADQLAGRRVLLVLDNCEHLIAACAELVAHVLRTCPDVVVLATSREALRLEGEVAWRVPSLALPDLHHLPDVPRLARQAAVQLFCERAAAARPGFTLTAGNARTVAELCIRLDGIPLALELAAARVRLLSPVQILERLGSALDVVGGDPRGVLSRQRTLRATLDWSHALLDDAQRVAFRRLAVFAGSFSLDAVEHVCGAVPLQGEEVLDLVGGLVDRSLVAVEAQDDRARYRLLETVRQYALEQLVAAEEHEQVAARHRGWYLRWTEQHDPEDAAAAGEESLDRFDVELDNLRAALRSALGVDPEAALRLAAGLWRFWLARGHFAEGRRSLEAALAANPGGTALRARGLMAAAVLDMRRGADDAGVGRSADEIMAIHRELDDAAALAQTAHLAAVLLWTAHRWDDAVAHLELARRLADDLHADAVLAASSHTLGMIELSRGRPAAALAHFDASRAALAHVDPDHGGFFPAISPGFSVDSDPPARPRITFEETLVMGHRLRAGPAAAHVRASQAWAARAAGDLDAAIGHARASAAGFEAHRWRYGVALAHNLLGNLHRLAGDHGTARVHLEASLALRTALGDRRAVGVTLGALGLLDAAAGDGGGGRRRLRGALALFERIEDGFGEAGMLVNLGVVALRADDLPLARRLLEQVRELPTAPGRRRPGGWVAVMLAEIAEREGDRSTAAARLDEARRTFSALGEESGLAHCDRVRPTAAT